MTAASSLPAGGTPASGGGARILLNAAAFVVIVAGMRSARTLLVPFLLSVFLAIICAPAVRWVRNRGVPDELAVFLVVLVLLGAGGLAGRSIGASIAEFTEELPERQEMLQQKVEDVLDWFASLRVFPRKDGDRPAEVSMGAKVPVEGRAAEDVPLVAPLRVAPSRDRDPVDGKLPSLIDSFDPANALSKVGDLINELGGLLANAFLILLTVVFILLEASGIKVKLRAALGAPRISFTVIQDFLDTVHRYMAIKTVISLATGAAISVWLAVLGVPEPLLWGVLAFLLNYIPNLGSILAAVPAVLVAWITLGNGGALATMVCFTVVNLVLGNFIEPRLMGQRLGLSTLVVFLSLVFWGWVLGPVGMLLSIPLTMTLKLGLLHNPDTRWIAVLLGSSPAARANAKPPSPRLPG